MIGEYITFYMEIMNRILTISIILLGLISSSCSAQDSKTNNHAQKEEKKLLDVVDVGSLKLFNNVSVFGLDTLSFYEQFGEPDSVYFKRGSYYNKKKKELVMCNTLFYGDYFLKSCLGIVYLDLVFFENSKTKVYNNNLSFSNQFTYDEAKRLFPNSANDKNCHPMFGRNLTAKYSEVPLERWNCMYLSDGKNGTIHFYFVDGVLRVMAFTTPPR